MSDEDDDDDIVNNGNKVDMVTYSNINALSSSPSDDENNTAPTKVRVVSFNDEPKIFIFHPGYPDSDLDTTTDDDDASGKGNDMETDDDVPLRNRTNADNDAEKIKTSVESTTGWSRSAMSTKDNANEDSGTRLEESLDAPTLHKSLTAYNTNSINHQNHTDLTATGPTTAEVLELQKRWEQYETEKHNLDEMEDKLQKRKTAVCEQERELEEYRAYLERRHKSLTKKEEDLCVLQDELEDLSDLLKEKREKVESEEQKTPDNSCKQDEDKIEEMKHRIQESESFEQELKQRLQTQKEKVEEKNKMITNLEIENEKLRSKMKRLEAKLTSDMTNTYGSFISDRQATFTSMVSSIPLDERSGKFRSMSSMSNADSSLQDTSQHPSINVLGSSDDSSSLSQRLFSGSSCASLQPKTTQREKGNIDKITLTSTGSNSSEYSFYTDCPEMNISQEISTCYDEDYEDDGANRRKDNANDELVLEEMEVENETFREELVPSRRWSLLRKSGNITSRTCLLM